MVKRADLASVLSEFARTLITDFPIQHILDRLVDNIMVLLPGMVAGVTLIDAQLAPQHIVASDRLALEFERVQSALGEGPCLEAYRTGQAVAVPDLAVDQRFPRFSAAARAAGLAAVFTFPMRHGDGRLGALDLYRLTAGPLSADELETAQTMADVAAAYLLNAQSREELSRVADHYHHTSLHDPLTALPNRALLEERLEHGSARAERSGTSAAVLFVDLDRLKLVNDRHGHEAGDLLLVAVADRLKHLVRPGDTLARLGGDEFVFLCEDLSRREDAEHLARRVVAAFDQPFPVQSLDLKVTASVGVAFSTLPDDLPRHLLGRADVAMYEAKRQGGGRHVVSTTLAGHVGYDRESLGGDLRAALDAGDLSVVYQPVVTLADGRLSGVEALLRWDRRGRGVVPPEVLIDVAEHVGLNSRIGLWVLERACTDAAAWRRQFPWQSLPVAVNVSPAQLLGPGFGRAVRQVLSSLGLHPGDLVLEVTESVVMQDPDRAVAMLSDLRAIGVQTALDDFGSGFSSLNYLRTLPVDIVKIDQSFIADMHTTTGEAIIASVTDLAHILGLAVTAEGIENAAQRQGLQRIGCDRAQGFFYARPMPAAALRELVAATANTAVSLPLQRPAPVGE